MYKLNKILNWIVLIYISSLLFYTYVEHNNILFLIILYLCFPKTRNESIQLLSPRVKYSKQTTLTYEIAELLINIYLIICVSRAHFDNMLNTFDMSSNFITQRILYVCIIMIVLNILLTLQNKAKIRS